jgi:N-glycosylase/DNA lyase
MEDVLLDVLRQYIAFLEDYRGQELDLHAAVRQQEVMLNTFMDNLSEDEKREFVDKMTELGAELSADGQERVTEFLEGLDLFDEYEV